MIYYILLFAVLAVVSNACIIYLIFMNEIKEQKAELQRLNDKLAANELILQLLIQDFTRLLFKNGVN